MIKKCIYVDGVCKNCGRPKGWRIHRMYRHGTYAMCPGKPLGKS